jgi:hypothetical protein
MTPKEKAVELYNKYEQLGKDFTRGVSIAEFAKQCALIAVDEIIKSEPRCPSDVDWDDVGGTHQYYYEAQREDADKYWEEVKKEIQKL